MWRGRLFLFEGDHLPFIYCEGWGWGTQTPKAFHSWFCCLIIPRKSFSQQWGCVLCSWAEGLLPLQKVSLEVNTSQWANTTAHVPVSLCLFIFNGITWIKKHIFHVVFWRQIIVLLLHSLLACHAQMNLCISVFPLKKQPCWVFPVVQSVTNHCC